MLLEVTIYSSHKLYAKNGSHKLTAWYTVYCTYKGRKRYIVKEEPGYYRRLLLKVTMYSYHKWYKKKLKPHIDGLIFLNFTYKVRKKSSIQVTAGYC